MNTKIESKNKNKLAALLLAAVGIIFMLSLCLVSISNTAAFAAPTQVSVADGDDLKAAVEAAEDNTELILEGTSYALSDAIAISGAKRLIISAGDTAAYITLADGSSARRHFIISGGAEVTMNDLFLTGGAVDISSGGNDDGDYAYGGISATGSDTSLNLNACKLSNMYSDEPGAALYALGATVTSYASDFSNNRSDAVGGGIYIEDGYFTAEATSIYWNLSSGDDACGGAIHAVNSPIAFVGEVSLSDNSPDEEDGIYTDTYITVPISTVEELISVTENPKNSYRYELQETAYELTKPLSIKKEKTFAVVAKQDGTKIEFVDGHTGSRHMEISGGANVTVENITFLGKAVSDTPIGDYQYGGISVKGEGTSLSLVSSKISGVYINESGGAICTEYSAVSMQSCELSGNSTSVSGGAIYAAEAVLALKNTKIMQNTSAYTGGGLYIDSSEVSITASCAINFNTANYGGGVYSFGSTLEIKNSEIKGNDTGTAGVGEGGGIYAGGGTVNLDATAISENTSGYGGGFFNNSAVLTFSNSTVGLNTGSGIYMVKGSSTLNNITFNNNTACYEGGGGLYVFSGTATLTSCRFNQNQAPTGNGGGGIQLAGGTLSLSGTSFSTNAATDVVFGGGAVLAIGGSLTVDGGSYNQNTTTAAGGAFCISMVDTDVPIKNISVSANVAAKGGGLNVDIGRVALEAVDINTNRTTNNGVGGGIYVNKDASLKVVGDSKIRSNTTVPTIGTAEANGGGVYNNGGKVSITDTAISGNSASGIGGGLYQASGSTSITYTALKANTARQNAGGIYVESGKLYLESSTLTENYVDARDVIVETVASALYIKETTEAAIFLNTIAFNTRVSLSSNVYAVYIYASNNAGQNTYIVGNIVIKNDGGNIFGNPSVNSKNILADSAAVRVFARGWSGSYIEENGQYRTLSGGDTVDKVVNNDFDGTGFTYQAIADARADKGSLFGNSLDIGAYELDASALCSVIFSDDSGSLLFMVDIASGSTIPTSEGKINPALLPGGAAWFTRTGFTFAHWYECIKDTDNSEAPFAFDTTITESMEIRANWSRNSYTVTLIFKDLSKETLTFKYGAVIDLSSTLDRDGYIWKLFSDDTFTEEFVLPDTMPAENITAYVKWRARVDNWSTMVVASGTGTIEAAVNSVIASEGDKIIFLLNGSYTMADTVRIVDDYSFIFMIDSRSGSTASSVNILLASGANGRHFEIMSGANVTFIGITFDGNASVQPNEGEYKHGGLSVSGKTTSVALYSTKIQNIYTNINGGALSVTSSTVLLSDCVISNCLTARNGGGIYAENAKLSVLSGQAIAEATLAEITRLSAGTLLSTKLSGLNLTKSIVSNNNGGSGGGIFLKDNATLTLENAEVSYNTAAGGGEGGNGGGIYAGLGTKVLIRLSEIKGNNSTKGGGGGLYTDGGEIRIISAEIKENSANYGGGGIYIYIGYVQINDTVISANTAAFRGGGIAMNAGELAFTSGEISGNTTTYSYNSYGGGIYLDGGTALLKNTKITGNSTGAEGYGGGINVTGGEVEINNTLISKNTAYYGGGIAASGGTLDVYGNLVSENTAFYGGGIYAGSDSVIDVLGVTITKNTAKAASLSGSGVHISETKKAHFLYNTAAFNIQPTASQASVFAFFFESSLSAQRTVMAANIILGHGTGNNINRAANVNLNNLSDEAAIKNVLNLTWNGEYSVADDGRYIIKNLGDAHNKVSVLGYSNTDYTQSDMLNIFGSSRLIGTNMDIGAYELNTDEITTVIFYDYTVTEMFQVDINIEDGLPMTENRDINPELFNAYGYTDYNVREGYTFRGWFTDQSCIYKFDGTLAAGTLKLYAGWEKIPVVDPVPPTDPDTPDPTDPSNPSGSKGLSGGALAAILIVSAIVLSGGVVFAIYWFVFREKAAVGKKKDGKKDGKTSLKDKLAGKGKDKTEKTKEEKSKEEKPKKEKPQKKSKATDGQTDAPETAATETEATEAEPENK